MATEDAPREPLPRSLLLLYVALAAGYGAPVAALVGMVVIRFAPWGVTLALVLAGPVSMGFAALVGASVTAVTARQLLSGGQLARRFLTAVALAAGLVLQLFAVGGGLLALEALLRGGPPGVIAWVDEGSRALGVGLSVFLWATAVGVFAVLPARRAGIACLPALLAAWLLLSTYTVVNRYEGTLYRLSPFGAEVLAPTSGDRDAPVDGDALCYQTRAKAVVVDRAGEASVVVTPPLLRRWAGLDHVQTVGENNLDDGHEVSFRCGRDVGLELVASAAARHMEKHGCSQLGPDTPPRVEGGMTYWTGRFSGPASSAPSRVP